MKIKSIFFVLVLLMSIGIVSATPVTTIVKSEYPEWLAELGIGEVVYKTTNNGDVSYRLSRGGLQGLQVISNTPNVINVDANTPVSWSFSIKGCCRNLDSLSTHKHIVALYNLDTGAKINMVERDVGAEETWTTNINLGSFSSGEHKFEIHELIYLLAIDGSGYTRVNGNSIFVTVVVRIPQPTPTITVTPYPTYTPQPTMTTPQVTMTTPSPPPPPPPPPQIKFIPDIVLDFFAWLFGLIGVKL